MGCEGGICWVLLAEPVRENQEKLRQLLPWHMLTWDKYHNYVDGCDDMGHNLFMDEIPGNSLSATWDSRSDGPALCDLNYILRCQEYIEEDWGGGEVTLAMLLEVAKDTKDRSHYDSLWSWPSYNYRTFNEMLLQSYEYGIYEGEKDVNILKMSLSEWCDAVRSCCQTYKKNTDVVCERIETWT